MARYDDDMWGYTPAPAIKVEGGIKTARTKGAMANQWWGKRWIQSLERGSSGARLTRGRSYARRGQVVSLNIETGAVEAVVQGSQVKPYKVDIVWPVFDLKAWGKIAAAMALKPLMAAQLIQGQMPEDIETLFAKAGLNLMPLSLGELKARCSCPDSANPCKHIAAVCYLLAEALDRDPFLMFKLRGIEREDFLARLGLDREEEPAAADPSLAPGASNTPPEAEPLPLEPGLFWQAVEVAGPGRGLARAPATDAAWPKRLGSLPLWRSQLSFIDTMEAYYGRTSRYAEEQGEKLRCDD